MAKVPVQAGAKRYAATTGLSVSPEVGAQRQLLLVETTPGCGAWAQTSLAGKARIRTATSLELASELRRSQNFDALLIAFDHIAEPNHNMDALQRLARDLPTLALTQQRTAQAHALAVVLGAELITRDFDYAHLLGLALQSAIARHAEQAQYRNLLLASSDGVVVSDAEGLIQFTNPAADRLLTEFAGNALGRHLDLTRFGASAEADSGSNPYRISAGGERFLEARAATVEWNGRACRLLALRDATAHVAAEEAASGLVTQLRSANEALERDATSDPLTGVLNRRGLRTALVDELARGQRSNAVLSALLIDCDDFKAINETYGHAAGDVTLRTVAEVAARTVRPGDRVGRIGGDEFLVLLPSTRAAAAVQAGQRILRQLALTPLPGLDASVRISISVGATRVPPTTQSIEEVVAAAQSALKSAKRHGKQRVLMTTEEFSKDSWPPPAQQSIDLVDASELRAVAQAIVSMQDTRVVACELLVRGPRGELELPGALFQMARAVDRLHAFDLDCIHTLVAASARLPVSARQHLNVLPSTLLSEASSALLRLLEQRPHPKALCIEISEPDIVGDPRALCAIREKLRAMGILVALDHFGFSCHALESLIVLQPEIVKIGNGSLEHAADAQGQWRDLRRLVGIARSVGAEIIAERVESHATADALRDLGVGFGQGFLWGKPAELVGGAS